MSVSCQRDQPIGSSRTRMFHNVSTWTRCSIWTTLQFSVRVRRGHRLCQRTPPTVSRKQGIRSPQSRPNAAFPTAFLLHHHAGSTQTTVTAPSRCVDGSPPINWFMADSVCICCGSVSLRCQKKCSADHWLEKFAVSTGVKGDTSATFTKLDGCKGMTSELALSVTGRWLSIPSQRDRAGEVGFSDRSSAVSPPQIPYGSSAWSAWDRQ